MIYFLRRGESRLSSETRLNPAGPGYELVVTTDGVMHIEPFQDLATLLSREHELLQAWRAIGWRETGAPTLAAEPTTSDEDWFGRRR